MKQKVLITGASGFIGLHLLDAALAKGLDVYTGIRKSSAVAHLSEYPVTHTYIDYTDTAAMRQMMDENRLDYIIHAAGATKAGSQDLYNNINSQYTYNLAKAASQAATPLKKIVFISSLASIGPLNDTGQCITGDTLPHPVTAYGRSKLLAEQKLAEFNLPWIILRPTAVYGPGERDIFILVKMISRGIEAYIGKKEQKLSFVYVKDLARLAVNALFSSVKGQSYNITDGNAYSKYEFADITKSYLNKKSLRFHLSPALVHGLASSMERIYGAFNKTAVVNREKLLELTGVNWACNIDKARQDLDFAPEYNLEKGLRETLDWYRQKHWL